MGNVVVPLVVLGASGAAIYAGVTNPEGGAFAGLGRVLRGQPVGTTNTGFASTAADLAHVGGSAAAGSGSGSTTTTGYTGGGAVNVSGIRAQVLTEASTWLGVPYLWSGSTRDGVDCSGLTTRVYATVGVTLPRVSAAQALAGRRRTLASAKPGDLVFFARAGVVHHVGIYVGGGQILHAPHPGTVVRVEPIWTGETVTVRDVLTGHAHKTKTQTGTVKA